MDERKREIRNLECELSFREAAPGEATEGELGTITGKAIVFNVESEVLDEKGQLFREVILPEAVTMDFLNSQDIKVNLLHERSLTFGRVRFGNNQNARFWVDDEAMWFEQKVPNCDLGIRARELTRTGVYTGCSFEFFADDYDVEQRAGEIPLVRHKKFRYITAITLGMDPAYQSTSLSARELHTRTDLYQQELKAEEEQKRQREESLRAEMKRRLTILKSFN